MTGGVGDPEAEIRKQARGRRAPSGQHMQSGDGMLTKVTLRRRPEAFSETYRQF